MTAIILIVIGTLQQFFGFFILVALADAYPNAHKKVIGESDIGQAIAVLLWPITAVIVWLRQYIFNDEHEEL